MLLYGLENTDSTNVVSTSKVNGCSVDKLVNTLDAFFCQVNLKKIAFNTN